MGIVVAIDGPSGAGKSSTAKLIAHRAGWNYLDTGALYRGVTWLSLEKNEQDPRKLIELLKLFPLRFNCDAQDPVLFVGDTDVNVAIRSQQVTDRVSHIDIGNVVAPESPLKLYLTADLEARATRREAEIATPDVSTEAVKNSLDGRDLIDTTRKVSPLQMASDAVLIDSTLLNLEETVERVWELLRERNLLGLPIVAILGRPNVGKSTLINRFIGRREAIVEDTPGVTRDRVQYECVWGGRRFIVMDTGGWESKPDGISIAVSAGAEIAMEQSDVLCFVVDAQIGALDEDDVLVQELRKMKKPIILIANKVDGEREESDAHSVSALHGRGSGDLLDKVVSQLPEVGRAQVQDGYRRVALIGRPNVGKSSLLNALAGEERSIVSEIAGTTRDPVDELITFGGSTWRFIDTAGLRKRSNQASGTDYYASLRTQAAIERCEVAVIVLDASEAISEQDLRILTMAEEAGKAMVIVMNKWDLVDEDRRDQLDREIDRHLDQIEWAQRVNVAAKTGWPKDFLCHTSRHCTA